MSRLPKSERGNMGFDGVPAVKSKHYCEIQRPYHLNMRIDASDEDRTSQLKQTNDYLGQQCKQDPNS